MRSFRSADLESDIFNTPLATAPRRGSIGLTFKNHLERAKPPERTLIKTFEEPTTLFSCASPTKSNKTLDVGMCDMIRLVSKFGWT